MGSSNISLTYLPLSSVAFPSKMRETIKHIFLFLFALSSSLTTKNPRDTVPFLSQVEPEQTIENIFLYKVKENTSEATVNLLIHELKGLIVIPGVLYLTAGPIHHIYSSSSSSLDFGIFLHTRFATKKDLEYFRHHPLHLKLIHDLTDPLLGDYMLVDWVFYHQKPLAHPLPGSLMRVTSFKLKRFGNSEKRKVFLAIRDKLSGGKSVEQYTYGENFSTAAKGFSMASLSINKLKKTGSCHELAKEIDRELKDLVESILIVDYIVE